MDRSPPDELIARFRAAFDSRDWRFERLGLAVSGGPDSLALLLLAHAAFGGRVEAASIDHGLRAEGADEAQMVADLCGALGVPHRILAVQVAEGNLQDEARRARYAALAGWMDERGIDALATAHHADDQAETLLMRLNRGSGLGGLAGVRAATKVPGTDRPLVRPLLAWRKQELEQVVADCGIAAARDPSNLDDRFDRVRVRKQLAEADWLDPIAIAGSAANLADAEEALQWMAVREWEAHVRRDGGNGFTYRPEAPRAVRLIVLGRMIEEMGGSPRGGAVADLLEGLECGRPGNVAGVLARPTEEGWVLRREPPRR